MLWFIIFVICERVDILILVGIDMLKDIERMKKEIKMCYKIY